MNKSLAGQLVQAAWRGFIWYIETVCFLSDQQLTMLVAGFDRVAISDTHSIKSICSPQYQFEFGDVSLRSRWGDTRTVAYSFAKW